MSINSAFFNQLKSALVPLLRNVIARIPTKVSDLTNDSGFIAASAVSQATKASTVAGTAGTPTILVSEETTSGNDTSYTLKRYTGDVLKSKLGIGSGGGGGTDHDFIVTGDLDPDTMTLSNVSHTLAQIVAAAEANKDVRFNAIAEVEGVGKIIFSIPLAHSQSIEYEGTTYYSAEFCTAITGSDDTTYVNVHASTGDNNSDFVISFSTQPSPTDLSVTINPNGAISSVSGLTLESIEIASSDYPDSLHVSVSQSNWNGDELIMRRTQSRLSVAQYEGTREGIKYTLCVQVYDDVQDVPSGVYYETVYDDEDPLYVAFTLDRDLDGVSYIQISAATTVQNNVSATTISGVTLPDSFSEKLSILTSKPQFGNVNVIVNETNQFDAIFYVPLQHTALPVCEGLTFTARNNNLAQLIRVYCKIEIAATQPESGYYEQLPDGSYLNIACDILQA